MSAEVDMPPMRKEDEVAVGRWGGGDIGGPSGTRRGLGGGAAEHGRWGGDPMEEGSCRTRSCTCVGLKPVGKT